MSTYIFDLKNSSGWTEAFNLLPLEKQDIYYTPAYCGLYDAAGKYLRCFVFKSGGETALYPFLLRPIEPLKLCESASGFFDMEGVYGYNGVAASSCDEAFRKDFHQALDEYCSAKKVVAEFTRFHPLLKNYEFSESFMDIIPDRKTVFIDLRKGYDDVWENAYDAKNRNSVRKALKEGLKASVSQKIEDYLEFHDLYTKAMQKLGASEFYFFDEEYFKNISALKSEIIKVSDSSGKISAAALVMFHGIYAHYHLAARNPESTNSGSANLVLDEAVKSAVSRSCQFMHLGGGYSNGDDSLMRFKKGFSSLRGQFTIGKKVRNPQLYSEICRAWELKYPEKVEAYSKFLLKYRN